MRPCENVIVTLAAGETALDMELPAFLPFAELTPKIAETLAVMEPRRFGGASLELRFGGQPVAPEKCLAAYGIWDGSVLQCAVRKE